MKLVQYATATLFVCAAMALATPAHADPGCIHGACPSTDIDFANQLHTYGIYGPRDYDAWIGKITCERLRTGLDTDASASHQFVVAQLPRPMTDVQAWQFLGTAVTSYCPDQASVLKQPSAQNVLMSLRGTN